MSLSRPQPITAPTIKPLGSPFMATQWQMAASSTLRPLLALSVCLRPDLPGRPVADSGIAGGGMGMIPLLFPFVPSLPSLPQSGPLKSS